MQPRLDACIAPWTGDTFVHIPATTPLEVLDFSHAATASNNRWNARGEPTLYLAGDRGVAFAEFARHIERDRPPSAVAGSLEHRLYRFRLSIDVVLDLCRADSWDALSISGAPHCFLDRFYARAVAQYVRNATSIQAIRVPSMAFLDDLTRWVLVVFLDKLPTDSTQFVHHCVAEDLFSVGHDEPPFAGMVS